MSLDQVGNDILGLVLLFLDKDADVLNKSLAPLNRALRDQLRDEVSGFINESTEHKTDRKCIKALGRVLCISAWHIDDARFAQWPTLTSW